MDGRWFYRDAWLSLYGQFVIWGLLPLPRPEKKTPNKNKKSQNKTTKPYTQTQMCRHLGKTGLRRDRTSRLWLDAAQNAQSESRLFVTQASVENSFLAFCTIKKNSIYGTCLYRKTLFAPPSSRFSQVTSHMFCNLLNLCCIVQHVDLNSNQDGYIEMIITRGSSLNTSKWSF